MIGGGGIPSGLWSILRDGADHNGGGKGGSCVDLGTGYHA